MKQRGTTSSDGTTELFAGDAWFDLIEAGIRERDHGFVQELLEQEPTAALGGRAKHEQRAEQLRTIETGRLSASPPAVKNAARNRA